MAVIIWAYIFATEDLDKIAKLDASHKGKTGDWDPWEHEETTGDPLLPL